MLSDLTIDVDKKDQFGRTALHSAAKYNNASWIAYLLSHKANVNVKDDCGKTPLHEAAMNNIRDSHFEAVEMLLKNGAEINARDHEGKTPIHFVINHASAKMLGLFLNFKAIVTAVNRASGENLLFPAIQYRRNVEVLQMLLDLGLDVNHRDKDGRTPLHCASSARMSTKIRIMKCLMKNGADINAVDSQGSTPFVEVLHGMRLGWDATMVDDLNFIIEHADFSLNHSKVNTLTFDREPLWKTVLKHLAKLDVIGIPVHPNFLNDISKKPEYRSYYDECKDELLRAKGAKLQNSWITFYNLLVDDRRRLKNYAGNSELVENFEKSDCEERYSIYGASMVENVKRGVRRRDLFDKSAVLLSDCLPVFSPTHLIVRDVLDCVLSKKDLSKFCE